MVSMPPAMATLATPLSSSCTAFFKAASDEPHAASTVWLVPPKSKRLATRPAATFSNSPENDSSFQSGSLSNTSGLGLPTTLSNSVRAAYCTPKSPSPPLAPKITEVFSLSKLPLS